MSDGWWMNVCDEWMWCGVDVVYGVYEVCVDRVVCVARPTETEQLQARTHNATFAHTAHCTTHHEGDHTASRREGIDCGAMRRDTREQAHSDRT